MSLSVSVVEFKSIEVSPGRASPTKCWSRASAGFVLSHRVPPSSSDPVAVLAVMAGSAAASL